MNRIRTSILVLAASATVLGACGDDKKEPAATIAATTPATTPVTTATSSSASGSTAASGTSSAAASGTNSTAKVSANTASDSEILAALNGAGVSNADKWLDEIKEYRPYDASDPSLQKLRDELAKYNPDAATLDAILGVLQP